MIHADVPPPAPEENTKAEQYVVRVARFIRNRYIQHGLAGEFTVGRTLGVSTKALLVKVRESDIADGVDDDETVDDVGGDIGPSKKEQQSAGRALTALVSSSLAEMMRKSGPAHCASHRGGRITHKMSPGSIIFASRLAAARENVARPDFASHRGSA